jgi:putative hydrolase of the HAD superfamily
MLEEPTCLVPGALAGASLSAAQRLGLMSPRLPDLGGIETWVFDLDNTLYPPHADLWPKIDHRITVFLADLLGLDGLSARALQKHYYQRYGTTLNGLMAEHPEAIEPKRFLDFVHDIDRTTLMIDAPLAEAIDRLPGRRLVFTNGSRGHAEKTMLALGIAHLFDDVFDIVAGDFRPKPDPVTYAKFLLDHEVDPARAIMFEDIAKNLEPCKTLGMTTVLVVPRQGAADHREAWEVTHRAPAYVDHVTDDLAGFLSGALG